MHDLVRSKGGVRVALAGGLGAAGILAAAWTLADGSRTPERAVFRPSESNLEPQSVGGALEASKTLDTPLEPLREALARPMTTPSIEAVAVAAPTAPLPLPAVVPAVRLPDLGGLMLDPSGDAAAFATDNAPRAAAELARARFRLQQILQAFDASGGASPIVWLLASDRAAIDAELLAVDERFAALAITVDTGSALPAEPGDDDAVYALRHAGAHSEELFVRRTLVARALNAEEQRESKRKWALGEYEVVPETVLMA
ncbi:MAG: hypothetical protein HZA53_16550 [Planctomycetes bacterium]|nr:hypothetical protein [Planctomycetota bacterium]